MNNDDQEQPPPQDGRPEAGGSESGDHGFEVTRDGYEDRMVDAALRPPPNLTAQILQAAQIPEADGSQSDAVHPEDADAPTLTPDSLPDAPRLPNFRRLWKVAACVAALAILGAVGRWGWHAWRSEALLDQMHLVVSAPPAVPDGAPIRFQVETHDFTQRPREAEVEWRILDEAGETLRTGSTVCSGIADITAPGDLRQPRKLVVTVRDPAGDFEKTVEQAIRPSESAPLVHITSDKPAYRPGEPVMLRVTCLQRLSLHGIQRAGLRCRVTDPLGAEVTSLVLGIGAGVGGWAWHIPADATGGEYAFEVQDSEGQLTLEKHEFLVRNFQPPKLEKRITLDRQTYAEGAVGTAEIAVRRAGVEVAAGAKISASLVVDGETAWQETNVLDGSGRSSFRFTIPAKVRHGAARFVARITDGGDIETAIEPFVIPTGRVEAALCPESGELIAGTENRVYAQLSDSLGRPVSGTGAILDDRGETITSFTTQHMGRGRFQFTPQPDRTYRLRLDQPTDQAFDLPAIHSEGVALRTEPFIAGGAPAKLRIFAAGRGPWTAAVFCRGVLVGQRSIRTPGERIVSVPILAEAGGVLRVTVFDEQLRPVAERLVFREAERNLRVELTASSMRAAPGTRQKIHVRTTDENDRPVSAIVGLTVSDRAIFDMLDTTRIGLADRRDLWTDVERPDDKVHEFLASDQHHRRNVDLLLGSQGWRRYVWRGGRDAEELAAAGGEWGRSLPVREGRSWAPVITDGASFNSDEAWEVEMALWDRYQAKKTGVGAVALLLLLAAILRFWQFFVRLCWRRGWEQPVEVGSLLTFVSVVLGLISLWGIMILTLWSSSSASGDDRANPVAEAFSNRGGFLESLGGALLGEGAPGHSQLAQASRATPPSTERGGDESGQDWNYVRGFAVETAQSASVARHIQASDRRLFGGEFDVHSLRVSATAPNPLPFDLAAGDPTWLNSTRHPRIPGPGELEKLVETTEEITDLLQALKQLAPNADWDGAELDQLLRKNSAHLEMISTMYPGISTILPPFVSGRVQDASLNGKMVTIELHRGAKLLQKGHTFAIYNVEQGYKAEAIVTEIEADRRYCFASITLKAGPGPISAGDKASTDVTLTGQEIRITPTQRQAIDQIVGNPFLNRICYRYEHEAADHRSQFVETLLWKPFLTTDANGEASTEFDISDSTTTWRIDADAHGAGRVGQGETSFESYLPFSIDATVPSRATDGDIVRIPVRVVAEDRGATKATLEFHTDGPVALAAPEPVEVPLHEGRGRHLVELKVTPPGIAQDSSQSIDQTLATLTIRGRLAGASDVLQRRFPVAPRGFPIREERAGTIRVETTIDLHIPDELARRTAAAKLTLYPSPVADLDEALQGMLREPHGCFEQVSSSNYPNVLTLSLLQDNDRDSRVGSGGDAHVATLSTEARQLLQDGYRKLAGFEVAGGGFDWWGRPPAHASLTAYGLMQFTDMAKVFEVNPALIARTRRWLMERRDGRGGFTTGSGDRAQFLGGTRSSRNTYLTYALLYAGQPKESLTAELDQLEVRARTTGDAYELAIATCALSAAGRTTAVQARARLTSMLAPDGSLTGQATITSSGATDRRIETTAFGILAWLSSPNPPASVRRSIDFLLTQRRGNGTFGGTQATVLTLKALHAFLDADTTTLHPGKISVSIAGQVVMQRTLRGTERRAITFEHLERHFAIGDNRVRIQVSHGNELPFGFESTYRSERPQTSKDSRLTLETRLGKAVLREGDPTAVHLTLRNHSRDPVANPMVILGLPSGLHVPVKILDDLKKSGSIAAWEATDGRVILYFRGIPARGEIQLVLDASGRIPGVTTGPASCAYPYYDNRQIAWADPLQVDIAAGR